MEAGADAYGNKNSWRPGEVAYFEYHCYMGHDSSDAEAWYRSQQPVTILSVTALGVGKTARARLNNGEPRVYKVRWQDGFEYDVMEDELYVDRSHFVDACKPPPSEEIAAARQKRQGG